ncbi:MAG: trypsin-like peptidase domain-containing protein [Methylococcaceae bacterium]|nr:trypsin-like peptidase domain-containing protein [Methylococcaceae bacterium]
MKRFSIAYCLIATSLCGCGAAIGGTAELAGAERLLREGAFKPVSEALRKAPPNTPATRQRGLILEAEAALALGQAHDAAGLFERAANQFDEAPEAEVGQVRAYFQEGEVRHAIALGNIVAGEHPDYTEASALLAWFEDRVGHTEHALAKLRDARSTRPDDVALLAAQAEILIDRGMASEAIQILDAWIARNPPQGVVFRLRAKAVFAVGDWNDTLRWRARSARAYESAGEWAQANSLHEWLDSVDPAGQARRDAEKQPGHPDSAPSISASAWHPPHLEPLLFPKGTIVANGLIIDSGRRVVTTTRVIEKIQGEVQIRNGLGQVRKARVERRYDEEGLAMLRLTQPYPANWSLKPERMTAPDGIKFCFVLGHAVADGLDSAYPLIGPGVVFRAATGVGGLMQITSELSRDHSGSPVFDSTGRLIGIALGKEDKIQGVPDREALLGKGNFAVRADILKRLSPIREKPSRKKSSMPDTPSVEDLYERLLPAVVLIAAPIAPERQAIQR